MFNTENTIFLIIDVQEKLLNAVFNKDTVEKKSLILAKTANILDIPIYVTEQYPQGLGETLTGLKEKAEVYTKTFFNALEDKELLNSINNKNRKQIVIWGIETHICVYQTALALLKEGFEVSVIVDACGSRTENEYNYGLKALRNNGAKIKTTEMIVFELIKTAKHPNFKEIQALIK